MNLRERTLEIAITQLGVHEEGGANRGPAVERYQRAGGGHAGDPWCADFENWCAEQAAAEQTVYSPLENVPLQGYVESLYEWAGKNKLLVEAENALPGDIFVLYFPSLKRYAHTGFVKKMQSNTFVTVEGNSNDDHSRDGVKVASNVRPITEHVKFIRWTKDVAPIR